MSTRERPAHRHPPNRFYSLFCTPSLSSFPLFPKFPSPLSSLTSSPLPFALLLLSPFYPLYHPPPSVPIGLISHTDHLCHSPLMAVLRFETSLITFSRESQRLFGYFHTLLFSQMPGPLESETRLTHLKMKTWLCHFFSLSLSLGHLLLWQLCSLFFFLQRSVKQFSSLSFPVDGFRVC